MGIQKVEVVQVGMEPVNPELLAHARTEDKVKVVAKEAARLPRITIPRGQRGLNSQALKWIVSAYALIPRACLFHSLDHEAVHLRPGRAHYPLVPITPSLISLQLQPLCLRHPKSWLRHPSHLGPLQTFS